MTQKRCCSKEAKAKAGQPVSWQSVGSTGCSRIFRKDLGEEVANIQSSFFCEQRQASLRSCKEGAAAVELPRCCAILAESLGFDRCPTPNLAAKCKRSNQDSPGRSAQFKDFRPLPGFISKNKQLAVLRRYGFAFCVKTCQISMDCAQQQGDKLLLLLQDTLQTHGGQRLAPKPRWAVQGWNFHV